MANIWDELERQAFEPNKKEAAPSGTSVWDTLEARAFGAEQPKRNALAAGFSSGVDELQGLAYSGAAAVADVTGLDKAKNWLDEQAQRNSVEAARNGRPDLERIEDQTLGSALPYLGYQVAKQVPNLIGGIAAGALVPEVAVPAALSRGAAMLPRFLGGGSLGAAEGFAAKKAALQAGQTFGKQVVGGAAFNEAQAVGSLYQSAVEGGQENPGAKALAGSLPYALTETLPEAMLVGRFVHGGFSGNMLSRAAKGFGTQAVTGATSEGLQNEMEMSLNPNLTEAQKASNRLNSIAAGGLVEGILGGAGSAVSRSTGRTAGSLLTGSDTNNGKDATTSPDNSAIDKAINSNSPEIPMGPPPREALTGPQLPEQAGPPAPSPQQVQAAQQQIAAQKQQEAQEAFNHVTATYGVESLDPETNRFKIGNKPLFGQGQVMSFVTGLDSAFNKLVPEHTEEQKTLFGAAIKSGAVPVANDAKPVTIAKAVTTYLQDWGLNDAANNQEAAQRIDTHIALAEGPKALKDATKLNEMHKAITGVDAPAFVKLQEQIGAEEATKANKTKPTKEGVTNGQLQQQGNPGLREVSVTGGTTKTSGEGIGNVRPVSIQPVGTASLGAGSLGLQTGAIPSSGVSTSTAATPSGTTASNAVQGQTEVIEDDRVFAINQIEKMANAAFGTRDAKIIMEFIATDGAVNKAQIADKLGLSRARITQITGAPKEGETFNEQIERMAAEKWGPRLFIEGKRMGYSKEDMLALFETTAKAQNEMAADTGETVNDQESEINAAPPTEEIYNTNADDVNPASSDEVNYGTEIGNEELSTSDEDGGQTASGYRIFNPKVSGTSELEDASSKNRAKFSKKDISAMSDSQLQNLAADDETSAEKILQIAEELTKRQQKRVSKGEPNAVQKQSTNAGNVRKPTRSSKEMGEANTERKEPTGTRQEGQTDEEAGAQAWNEGIKDFPDAPKFEELTTEQQEDWVSFGEENWTPADVQTELIKLAKESATGKAQFSRNEGAGKDETWDADGLTSLLKQMFVANKNFDNLISVVANYDELPAYVKNAVKKSEAIQAFVYGKRMYMLANQIQVGQELPVFLHEVGVHLGMENLLGTANYRKLAGQVMTWANAKNDSLETIIARSAKERVDAAVKAAKEAGEALTADEQLDEMLAYFVEEAVALGVNPTAIGKETSQVAQWFRSLVAALKVGLRKIGFGKFDKLSAGNIVDLAFGAAKLEISGAYHGTAAEFRNFKTIHIGTGEGAVAFGWGLYMAERFGIALDYMRSDVKRKQIRKTGEPNITYKGIGYKELGAMNHDLFVSDRLEYDRRNIASTMVRDLHYDHTNKLTVDSLIAKKIKTYEQGLEYAEDVLGSQNALLFKPNAKAIKEAETSKDYYERSLAAIKTIDPNDFDFPSKAGFTYKGRNKKDLRRAEMQNIGKDIENKVALDVVRAYEKATDAFGVAPSIEDVIKFEIEEQQKRINNNEIGALSGTIQKTIDALKALNPKDFVDSNKKPGNLMRVLPMAEEGVLMDLDERLLFQPDVYDKLVSGFPKEVLDAIKNKIGKIDIEDMTGRDLQRVLVDLENQGITDLFFQMPDSITDTIKQGRFMSEAIVSKYLEYKLGIEGVKYFDASSRNIGNQVSVTKLPEIQKIDFKVRGKKFIPKYASIRSNDVIIKGQVGDLSYVQARLSEHVSTEEVMAVIDHIKDEQARQTKNVVMFADKGVSRIATFEGAQKGGNVKFSLKKARETASEQVAKLPKPIRGPLQHIFDNVVDFAKKGVPWAAFTEDLADIAAKYIPSAAKYVSLMKERQAIRTKYERNIDLILQQYDKLPSEVKGVGEKSVNRFLKDMTMESKWAYNPGWIKNFDEAKDIDQVFKDRFEAMPASAQALIKEVFAQGNESLKAMQRAVTENINTEFDALIAAAQKAGEVEEEAELVKKKANSLTEYRTLMRTGSKTPYAPLKRFGNYVVVGRSKEYLAAENTRDDKTSTPDQKAEANKALREMEKNEDHYFVQFAETMGEAKAIAREEKGNYALVEPFEKDSARQALYGGKDVQGLFYRLRHMVEESADNSTADKTERAINRLLSDLHLSLLSNQSARQAERRRRKIAGAEDDMMRAFATQGRANAHFIASLENSESIYDNLRAMKEEADARTPGREDRRRYYNEFMKRHAMGLEYQPSPFIDKALSTTSAWMLLTNPAYYLQNMTQPFMMSLPVIGGKHGYARSWKEMTRAYNDIAGVIKKYGIGEESYSKLPEDVRKVVEELVNRGRIDISLEQDLGRWRSSEDSKFAAFGAATEKLRSIAQNIETLNRVATAVAAYRLDVKTSNPTAALNYADKIIYTTHGDYSGFNAPRVTRSSIGRLATQFRKFQLIQLSLMTRLFHDAFAGESKEVRQIGRRALAYTVGHTAVMGGAMGLPGFAALGMVLSKMFGDDDEPEDIELTMRRAIGNDALADLLVKGVPAMLGVDLSGKLGMGQMLSVLPYTDITLSRKGVYEVAGTLLTGPFGGLMAKAADGASYIGQGDYYKGIEQLLPTGLANVLKGARVASEGVTSRTGDLTMSPDEISFVDGFMVALGLPTKTMTDKAFLQNAKYEFDQFYNDKASEVKREYVRAYRSGDGVALTIAREDWKNLQESRAKNGYTKQPLSTLIKAPMEQTKRERNTIGGVAVNKSNRGFVKQTSEL